MSCALILAAGQGTRLRPLTDDKPKCLVSFCGESLLARQLRILHEEQIHPIHIATGYLHEQIEALGYPTSFNSRYDETNMVASLFSARDFMTASAESKQDFIIAYGDIVYQRENLQTLLACPDEIALMIDRNWYELWALRMENPLDDAETLVVDVQDYILELGKKTDSYDKIQGQYTGLIKIRHDKIVEVMRCYDQLDRSQSYDGKDFDNLYMTSFLQILIDSGIKTRAAFVTNGWLEIDSVADLQSYEKLAQQGSLQKFYQL